MSFFSPLSAYQLKQAYLSLKQKPGFVFSVVSTMSITLGALLCVLTLAYVMLLKPLPYPDQERLYQVEQRQIDNNGKFNVSGFNYPGLVDFYQNQQIFTEATMVDYHVSSLVSHPESPVIHSSYVTPEWFSLMNTPMTKGRFFSEKEGLNSYQHVAVISYKAWQTLYNGSDDIIGKKASTKNQTYTIIGVLAEQFVEPALLSVGYENQFWFPWDFNPTSDNNRKVWWGRSHQRTIIGKLANYIQLPKATKQSSTYVNEKWQLNNADSEYFKGWQVEIQLNALQDIIIGESKQAVILLLLSGICLVIIATMNILNLFISRLAEKQQSYAIHASVGAKPRTIFQTILLESSLLILTSLIVALVIASFSFDILQQYLANALPRVKELQLQTFTVTCAFFIGAFLAMIFAKFGSKSLDFKRLSSSFISGGKGQKAQISKNLRSFLIISQISVASVLLFICANISIKAIDKITYDDGLDVENQLSLQIRMYSEQLPSRAEREVLLEQLKHSLIALPQVSTVSRASSPLTGNLSTWSLTELDSMQQVLPLGRNVDHEYFNISGQKLIEGEFFTEQDVKDKTKKIIINQQLAKSIDPSGSILGRRLSFGTSNEDENAFVISGVVSGLKIPGDDAIPPRVYKPSNNAFNMTIQLKENQRLSQDTLLKVMKDTSKIFNIFKLESLAHLKHSKLYSYLVSLAATTAITVISIILTMIGLYGILSYSSQMRRFEIGTRMAIGAKGKDIIAMVIKDNASALLIGIVLSSLALLALYVGFSDNLTRYISISLVPIFIGTLGLIALITFFACYLPLRQYIKKPAIYSLRGSE
ncbi:ABC transporter permease [Colwelliaceae bacterium 6441]